MRYDVWVKENDNSSCYKLRGVARVDYGVYAAFTCFLDDKDEVIAFIRTEYIIVILREDAIYA